MNVNIFKNSYFNQNWGKKVYAKKKKKKKKNKKKKSVLQLKS